MEINLHGKTAIVTGSTSGIGFAIAKGMAEAAASVVLNDRNQEALTRALNNLKKDVHDAKIRGVVADLDTAAG